MGVFGSSMSQSRVGKEHKGTGALPVQHSSVQWHILRGSAFEICVTPLAGMLLHLGRFGFGYLSTSQLMSGSPARPSLLPKRQQDTSIGPLADLTELEWDIVSSQLLASLLEQTRSPNFLFTFR